MDYYFIKYLSVMKVSGHFFVTFQNITSLVYDRVLHRVAPLYVSMCGIMGVLCSSGADFAVIY